MRQGGHTGPRNGLIGDLRHPSEGDRDSSRLTVTADLSRLAIAGAWGWHARRTHPEHREKGASGGPGGVLGDPLFGPLPPRLERGPGLEHRFAADAPQRQSGGERHLGGQLEGPDTGGFAAGAWALMEQRPQLLAPSGCEDSMRGLRCTHRSSPMP